MAKTAAGRRLVAGLDGLLETQSPAGVPTRRAAALQDRHHFRYSLPDFVNARVTDQSAEGSAVQTDDFAPVNLYETMPVRREKRDWIEPVIQPRLGRVFHLRNFSTSETKTRPRRNQPRHFRMLKKSAPHTLV
jgi:hypothetical protein